MDDNDKSLVIQCQLFDILYYPLSNIDKRKEMIIALKNKIQATLRQCREYGIEYADFENLEERKKFLKRIKRESSIKDKCNEFSINYIKSDNDPSLSMQMKKNIKSATQQKWRLKKRRRLRTGNEIINVSF